MTASTHVHGYDPRTGLPTGDSVPATDPAEVGLTVDAAATAAAGWADLSRRERAAVLDAVANALDHHGPELVDVADRETALGRTRLTGEVARTTGQLRMFADVLRDGGYLGATVTPADPGTGRPDVRRMLHPLGPVAVFSASNFPFAFSVAGGDTASALAAGCPVVVKAHPGHPATSDAVAGVVRNALRSAGAPEGLFGLVHGLEAGTTLVRHPAIRAVGFTGSLAAGRALFDLAQSRPEPVPFFGELGSVNPVVILPRAAAERPGGLAEGFVSSLTLGTGQFCTNPGLLFVPRDATELLDAVAEAVTRAPGGPMLSARVRETFQRYADAPPEGTDHLATGTAADDAWSVAPTVRRCTLTEFADRADALGTEVFGPASLVVTYGTPTELVPVLSRLTGSLTATVHATDAEREAAGAVGSALRPRAGRLVYNGWPTGVAVCWAMHHGGPWPATTAPAHTSVGATAVSRWLAPTAYQDWPDALLPPELQNANPEGVPRVEQPAG